LSKLAQRIPALSDEALQSARAIPDEGRRSSMLATLAQCLRRKYLGQVLQATREMNKEESRARVLSVLTQRLPEITGEALESVRAINGELTRIVSLSVFAKWIPEISVEVIEKARAYKEDGFGRALLLVKLAQNLPEEYLEQVLELAKTIKKNSDCDRVLSALAQRLPEEYLGQVLELARAMEYEFNRAIVLSGLSQRLPELTGEALAETWKIDDILSDLRTDILRNLVKPMIEISFEECYLLVETSLHELSQQKRSELFSGISIIMPVIIHLGTDDTPSDIYEAVHAVTTWWP